VLAPDPRGYEDGDVPQLAGGVVNAILSENQDAGKTRSQSRIPGAARMVKHHSSLGEREQGSEGG
jgi:hypothetical protein